MAKKAAAQQVEPENESQEAPEEQVEREGYKLNGEQPQELPSQIDMVEAAINAGHDKPAAGVVFIRQKFGAEVDPRYFGVAKGNLKKRDGDYQPRPRSTAQTTMLPQSSGIPKGFGSDVKELRQIMEQVGGAEELINLIGQMSGLMGKYGAGGLTEIIEALG